MLIIYHTAYGFSIAFPIRGYRISAKVFVDFNEEGCRFWNKRSGLPRWGRSRAVSERYRASVASSVSGDILRVLHSEGRQIENKRQKEPLIPLPVRRPLDRELVNMLKKMWITAALPHDIITLFWHKIRILYRMIVYCWLLVISVVQWKNNGASV